MIVCPVASYIIFLMKTNYRLTIFIYAAIQSDGIIDSLQWVVTKYYLDS